MLNDHIRVTQIRFTMMGVVCVDVGVKKLVSTKICRNISRPAKSFV